MPVTGAWFPELASRQHVRDLTPVLEQSLSSCGLDLEDIDVVAVTYGPGLAGSLISGLNAAKAIAYTLDKPLIGVNHLEGHIYAAWLTPHNPAEEPGFPLACLVASGGHTDLLLMEGHGRYRLVGRTRDDAAGEAFDKAARILGLGFPGGPEIQRVAAGAEGDVNLPRAWMRDTHDFSFSGLKTALLHMAQDRGVYLAESDSVPEDATTADTIRELAAAFQESVVDVVSSKLVEMARKYRVRGLVLGGGVTANARLREEIVKRSSNASDHPPACAVHGQRRHGGRLRLLPVPAGRAMAHGPGCRPRVAPGVNPASVDVGAIPFLRSYGPSCVGPSPAKASFLRLRAE